MSGKREWTAERHAAAWGRCNRATPGPWKWIVYWLSSTRSDATWQDGWTSNSHRRLTAEDRQDGGVAYGTKQRDGCGDIVIGEADMAFIEEARLDLPDALREIERLTDPVDGLEAKLVERTAEREEAREWVRRLTREQRVLTCAFCGAEYPPGTPESNDAALTAHVRVCPKHPMRETEAEVSRLTDALDTAETCRESLRKGLEQASEQIAEMTAEAKVATAEIEQLRDTVHNYKALLAAAESAGREVCDERDEARAEIERLKAEEVAPVIERFREPFGADVPQAPSGKRTTAEDMRERAAQEAERALIEYAEIDVLDKTPERIRIARRIRALPL